VHQHRHRRRHDVDTRRQCTTDVGEWALSAGGPAIGPEVAQAIRGSRQDLAEVESRGDADRIATGENAGIDAIVLRSGDTEGYQLESRPVENRAKGNRSGVTGPPACDADQRTETSSRRGL